MFLYKPSTTGAYGRILDIDYVVAFGRLMRNLHRWGGEAMVAAVALHMCRVFYTGSYKPPREFNWILGVMLLFLTLALSFTGYLLPWDQLSFWAVTVGTNIASYAPLVGPKLQLSAVGRQRGRERRALRFYALHVIAIPCFAALLINYHIWRVIKDGGLAHPQENTAPAEAKVATAPRAEVVVQTFPTVLYVELAVFLVLMAALMATSLLINAPLEQQANPLQPNNPSKAPWYFLGLQEMVSYSAFWGGVIVPVLLTAFLVVLPYVGSDAERNRRVVRAGAQADSRCLDAYLDTDCGDYNDRSLLPRPQLEVLLAVAGLARCPGIAAGSGYYGKVGRCGRSLSNGHYRMGSPRQLRPGVGAV